MCTIARTLPCYLSPNILGSLYQEKFNRFVASRQSTQKHQPTRDRRSLHPVRVMIGRISASEH